MKERALLENKITDALAKHDVRLVRLEMSEYFGNILLVVATAHTQLRFVRDRGCNLCEVCKRNDGLHWEDDLLSSAPEFSGISDFCDFVDRVLTAKKQ